MGLGGSWILAGIMPVSLVVAACSEDEKPSDVTGGTGGRGTGGSGATSTGGSGGATGGSGGIAGAGGTSATGGSAGSPDCFTNPRTHFEIINACTDAQKIDKQSNLPLLQADGGLPPLP